VLLLIVVAFMLRCLAFAGLLPAWQGPDEPSHYAYAAEVAHGHLLPANRTAFATTPAIDAGVVGSAFLPYRNRTPDRPFAPPQRDALPVEASGLPDDPVAVVGYPPLFYLAVAPAYHLPGLDTASERLYALRAASVLLGACLLVLTFLLLRELVADDRLALLGVAFLSLMPMVLQASSIVNPDIGLTVAAAALTLAAVRVRTRGASIGRVAAVVAAAAAVALTKPIGPATALVLAGGLLGIPPVLRRVRPTWAAVTAVCVVGVVGLAAAGYVGSAYLRSRSGAQYGLSYLWQFYLPRLPFMQDVFPPGAVGDPTGLLTNPVPAWAVWVRTGVGYFGWVSAQLAPWLYVLALLSVLAVVAVAATAAARALRRPGVLAGEVGRVGAAGLLTAVGFLLLLHVAEAGHMIQFGGGDRLLQGRYLLPAAPLAVAVLVLGVSALPPRRAIATLGSLAAAWLVVTVGAFDALLGFYGR
jgi:4-amino-4-deoxy-L-arabinose transferase-like glycosyltransferase